MAASKTKAQKASSRLKVYMTQIGFHNWLVAAPNQKAALAAWDVRENLFAIGSASVVSDPDCIALAMKTPGEPVAVDSKSALSKATKVLRLDEHRSRKQPAKSAPVHQPKDPPKPAPRKRKVDRSKLDRAEAALEAFRKKAVRERAAIIRAQKALDLKADALEVDLEIEEAKLEEALEEARDHYDAEVAGR